MLLTELFNPHLNDLIKQSYHSLNDDNSKPSLGGLRQTRLTLGQIRRLRMMTDARNLERMAKLAQLRKQYVYIPPKGL